MIKSLRKICQYAFFLCSSDHETFARKLEDYTFKELDEKALCRELYPEEEALKSMSLFREIMRRREFSMHGEAFAAALEVANYGNLHCRELLNVIESVFQKEKYLLVVGFTVLGLDSLVKEILDSLSLSERSESPYLCIRQYLACYSEEACEHVRNILSCAQDDVKRVLCDIKRNGNLHEIDTLQNEFGIVSRETLGFFMNEELVFVLEHLFYTIEQIIEEFLWCEENIVFLAEGCHFRILEKVPKNVLVRVLQKIVEKEGVSAHSVIIVDVLLDTCLDEGRLEDTLYGSSLEFVLSVRSGDIAGLRSFMRTHKESVDARAILRWIGARRRWWAFEAVLEAIKETSGELKDAGNASLYTNDANQMDVLLQFDRTGLRLGMDGGCLSENIMCTIRSMQDTVYITRYHVKMIDALCRSKCWTLIERVRSRIPRKEVLDGYIISISNVSGQQYANEVCRYGDVRRVKRLFWSGAAPCTHGANNACEHGHLDIVAFLLENGIRPNHLGANSACSEGHKELVVFLLASGIKPDGNGIRDACENGHTEIVQVLFENGLRPDQEGDNYISVYKHIEIVELLRKKGFVYSICDADFVCKSGDEVLIRHFVENCAVPSVHGANNACWYFANVRILRFLFERGIKPDTYGANGACSNGSVDAVAYLYERGIKPNTRGANNACKGGHMKVIEYLWKNQIFPDADGADYACENGHSAVIDYLLKKEIRPTTFGANSACKNGHVSVVIRLLRNKVSPDADGANYACFSGHVDIVRYLAEKNIIPDVRGANNACTYGYTDIVRYLAKRGVHPDAVGVNNACEYDCLGVIRYLLEKGFAFNTSNANNACKQGSSRVLRYLVEKNIYPNNIGVEFARRNNCYSILEYLDARRIV